MKLTIELFDMELLNFTIYRHNPDYDLHASIKWYVYLRILGTPVVFVRKFSDGKIVF